MQSFSQDSDDKSAMSNNLNVQGKIYPGRINTAKRKSQDVQNQLKLDSPNPFQPFLGAKNIKKLKRSASKSQKRSKSPQPPFKI